MIDYKYPPGYVPMTEAEIEDVLRKRFTNYDDPHSENADLIESVRAAEPVILSRLPKPSGEPVAYVQFYKGEVNNLLWPEDYACCQPREHYTYIPLHYPSPDTAERDELVELIDEIAEYNVHEGGCVHRLLLRVRAYLNGKGGAE